MLVYNIAEQRTFKKVESLLKNIRAEHSNNPDVVLMLVGNCLEVPSIFRSVTTKEGEDFAGKFLSPISILSVTDVIKSPDIVKCTEINDKLKNTHTCNSSYKNIIVQCNDKKCIITHTYDRIKHVYHAFT